MTAREFSSQYLCSFEEAEGQVFRSDIIEQAFTNDIWPFWSDFAVDGVADHLFDPEHGAWRPAADIVFDRPMRTLEQVKFDVQRHICGAPGYNSDEVGERLILELEELEEERESGR